MHKYSIYRIENDGEPKKKMEYHGLNINSFFNSAKTWLYNGLYLVTNSDGSEAKTFLINRRI